jgi:SAM-dependent methyltransferase
MARTKPFDLYPDLYEEWFVRHRYAFESEIDAIRDVLPPGCGVEIGVGTGLFAERLGISDGVEPSAAMASLAAKRRVHVCRGVAEELPYHDGLFDFALMVTTICFVDDPRRAIMEMKRVVRTGGLVVQAFVDRDSPLGSQYEQSKEQNVFYRDAVFYSVEDIIHELEKAGLDIRTVRQTVFGELDVITAAQAHESGHGRGGFVVRRRQIIKVSNGL